MFRQPVKFAIPLVALLCAVLSAQQQPVFRENVSLVHVVASVKNAKDELVGALQKSDFKIFDNGVPQEIAVFERQTSQPLSVALMIDTSGSTYKDLKYETDSAGRFLRALLSEGNPQDAVALFHFDYQVQEIRSFTHNLASLENALRLLRGSGGGTSLYDAIYLGAGELEKREGRKVVIMISDGGNTTSSTDIQKSLRAAQLADASVYSVVVLPITNDAGRNTAGEHALIFMAEGTGGKTFFPVPGKELDKAFADIISELRTQYFLAYYPKNVPLPKNPFHRLEVKVNVPDLRVSARNGYYGDAESAGGSPYAQIAVSPAEKKKEAVSNPQQGAKSARAPEQTFEEAKYLKQLIENATPIKVKMEDGEEVSGTIEYYDQSFIRLTRKGEPNLFIFKHDIKYIQEED